MYHNLTQKITALALAAMLLISGCGPKAAASNDLRVLAVETFLADIAQNVAGDRAKVDALIPLGLDPHAFEPTPGDVAKISEAQVIIVNGAGFEAWLDKTMKNVSGQHQLITAANGLTSRAAREGEEAVLSDDDLAAAMCAEIDTQQPQPAAAGSSQTQAAPLPAESGLFDTRLALLEDGMYGGAFQLTPDESGDFQIAAGAGEIKVLNTATSTEVEVEKMLPLECGDFSQGNIIALEKDVTYLIQIASFPTEKIGLLVGPLGGGHHHDQGDPHFWLDPNKVMRYVENIRDGLIQADPEGKETYTRNAEAYLAKLKELDGWMRQQMDQIPADKRLIVTNHESFGYFADAYGFQVVGAIVPSVSTGAAPSAQQLAHLIDRIRETGVSTVFLETGSNPQLANQIASETGVRVITDLYTHSITAPDGKAPTYLDMMRQNTQAIVDALKP